jgi:hypothetical protein
MPLFKRIEQITLVSLVKKFIANWALLYNGQVSLMTNLAIPNLYIENVIKLFTSHKNDLIFGEENIFLYIMALVLRGHVYCNVLIMCMDIHAS